MSIKKSKHQSLIVSTYFVSQVSQDPVEQQDGGLWKRGLIAFSREN
jgi:hypothetical protein